MMVTPAYCVEMARYNVWQNKQLKALFETVGQAGLEQDRGAFFGSILSTANHVLWGDLLWMSRFDGGEAPGGGIDESPAQSGSAMDWAVARFRADARILLWAEALKAVDLTGELTWYSGAIEQEVRRPRALCVVHMFNHQTHHRGQIHAMLTAAGVKAPVSDLVFMPQDGPLL